MLETREIFGTLTINVCSSNIKIIKGNCYLLGLFLVFEIDINKIMISFQTSRIEVAIATSYKNND